MIFSLKILAYFFRSEVQTGNWFCIPYFNQPISTIDNQPMSAIDNEPRTTAATMAPSTHMSPRSMSRSEVKSTVTHPMTLQKRTSDIELPSTTTAVAVRKEIK